MPGSTVAQNFSQAFGYKVYLVPLLKGSVDLTDLALGGLGAGKFIDNTTLLANDSVIRRAVYADGTYKILTGCVSKTITNAALTSNVVTLTFAAATGFTVGESVVVEGLTNTFSGLNGTYEITAATTSAPYTISYALTASNVTTGAASGTATSGTDLGLDGADNPIRLLSLTDAGLDTTTKEEEVITYDIETKGFDQSVATGKGFSLKLAGVTDFADAGYKLMRFLEKDSVAYGTMGKLARIGPTGSTETVYGFGRFTNFSEKNAAGGIVKWEATFKGYGPYDLDV